MFSNNEYTTINNTMYIRSSYMREDKYTKPFQYDLTFPLDIDCFTIEKAYSDEFQTHYDQHMLNMPESAQQILKSSFIQDYNTAVTSFKTEFRKYDVTIINNCDWRKLPNKLPMSPLIYHMAISRITYYNAVCSMTIVYIAKVNYDSNDKCTINVDADLRCHWSLKTNSRGFNDINGVMYTCSLKCEQPNVDQLNIDTTNIDTTNVDQLNVDQFNVDQLNVDQPNVDKNTNDDSDYMNVQVDDK